MFKISSSRLSVNKLTARPSMNKSNAPKEDKKAAQEEQMDEVFQNNFHIVTALLPTITFRYAETVRKWVTKLLEPTINRKVRNSYVAFLAFQMQNMKISEPFNEMPPKVLEEPTKMMNAAKWKTIMQDADKNYVERLRDMTSPQILINFRRDFKTPMNFLDDQPTPLNGIIAYGGCFSNHFAN
ncbi:unnamed protein product [Chironomus riparius]|uniref:DUF4485 domain-containing protein n=1 Tax=Chironomus riparius TaxID=315576 RepID=A0A9N9WW63_9DIPT|nr:unnamed protein product [Chironomus riparius]